MDEPQKHYAKWKNPDSKDISGKDKIIEMERRSVIVWGRKWVWEFWGGKKFSILKFNCGSDITEYMPAANSLLTILKAKYVSSLHNFKYSFSCC